MTTMVRDMSLHRVFYALPLPAEACRQLAQWRDPMLGVGKAVPAANFHLTLAFLGEVNAVMVEKLMAQDFSRYQGFELQFGELAYFSGAKCLTVIPNHIPAPLQVLAQRCAQLQQHFGRGKAHKSYRPHITIYRHAEPPIPAPLQPLQLTLPCYQMALYESIPLAQGVRYQPLQQWSLAPQ